MTFIMKKGREKILNLVPNASKFNAFVLRGRFFGGFKVNLEIEPSLQNLEL